MVLISLKVCFDLFSIQCLVAHSEIEMVPSLDNFVSYGTEVIASRPDYVQSLVDIYRTSVVNEHLGENDAVNGSKLAESLLLNLRGRVDDVRYFPYSLVDFANSAILVSSSHR